MIEVMRSKRLSFSAWELEDSEEFSLLCARPGISDFASASYQNVTLSKAFVFVSKQHADYLKFGCCKFGVSLLETSELIGISGIFAADEPNAGSFEINYRFVREFWGKGLGAEAASAMIDFGFDRLGLEHVYAVVRADNIYSENVLKKIGMTVDREVQWNGYPAKVWVIRKL